MDIPALKFVTRKTRPQRILSIPGVGNLRELGGYPTRDGRSTRWKALLRSAGLDGLMGDGQRKLIEYGLRTDIDLRAYYQRETGPDVFHDSSEVIYKPLPVFDSQEFEDRIARQPTVADGYWLMLVERAPAFRAVIEAVASAPDGATLIHCAAGKDRTGLAIVLLLGAVGVPSGVIVEDYALSQKILTDPADEFRQLALARGYQPHEYDEMMRTDPDTMRDVLERLDARFGGLTGYLKAIGLTDDTLTRLRARLVDAGPAK